MKKYIDLLTVGNLTPNILKALAPLRSRYNIVSCRNLATTELVNSSKLILQEDKGTIKINSDIAELSYLEDYITNAIMNANGGERLDLYYAIAVNKSNIHNFKKIATEIGVHDGRCVCLLILPKQEFKSIDALPKDVIDFIDSCPENIAIIESEYNYDYSRLIPAVKYMHENNLLDKDLIQLNLDQNYSYYAFDKLHRLIKETDNITITNSNTLDTIFDTVVLSNSLTYVKPNFFSNMLWDGLRPTVISNSPAKYWHTFCLWTANICKGNYYTKFENVNFDENISVLSERAKAFYFELARMGINKLLTE